MISLLINAHRKLGTTPIAVYCINIYLSSRWMSLWQFTTNIMIPEHIPPDMTRNLNISKVLQLATPKILSAMQFPAGLFSLVVLLPLLSLAAKNPKRGVPFSIISNTEPGDIAKANQSSSAISWVYNYQASIPSYLASSGLEYIPMQWGSDGISSFVATVEAEGAKTILVSVSSIQNIV